MIDVGVIQNGAGPAPPSSRKAPTLWGPTALIVCGHTIGEYAFIGAGAVVTKDVPEHALMVGNPAKQIGWMCICGEKIDEHLKCKTCHHEFEKTNNGLILTAKLHLDTES